MEFNSSEAESKLDTMAFEANDQLEKSTLLHTDDSDFIKNVETLETIKFLIGDDNLNNYPSETLNNQQVSTDKYLFALEDNCDCNNCYNNNYYKRSSCNVSNFVSYILSFYKCESIFTFQWRFFDLPMNSCQASQVKSEFLSPFYQKKSLKFTSDYSLNFFFESGSPILKLIYMVGTRVFGW